AMYWFCTYFDHRYLDRGLVLYETLRRHCRDFRLIVLCLSPECFDVLGQLALPSTIPLRLEDLEAGDAELLRARQNRSLIDYYFTLTPSLPLYVLKRFLEIDLITYIDADIGFFSDPGPIYDEIGGHSIAIVEHRFPPELKYMEKSGIYNVGWMSIRRDLHGLSCLNWYRERCNEWCHDRHENGKFADQKYLDDWPERFENVIVLQHKGADLAPWNLANYTISENDGKLFVDGQPLIFFHFHVLQHIAGPLYDAALTRYGIPLPPIVRMKIYVPYIQAWRQVQREKLHFSCFSKDGIRREDATQFVGLQGLFPSLFGALKKGRVALRVLRNGSWVVCGGI
ncbi:MAG: hypothetical protein WCQ99_05440, partial [Pseudomonadota bacterium]